MCCVKKDMIVDVYKNTCKKRILCIDNDFGAKSFIYLQNVVLRFKLVFFLTLEIF